MKHLIDIKLVAISLCSFVIAQLLLSTAISSTASSSGGSPLANFAWLLVNFGAYPLAAIIGFLTAHFAQGHKILHGILAVALGALLFVVRVGFNHAGLVFALFCTLFGSLGAILARFVRSRNGA